TLNHGSYRLSLHDALPISVDNPKGLKVVRFNGTRTFRNDVVASPQADQLQLIPKDTTNPDLTKRNPSPVIFPGVNMWRLAEFKRSEEHTSELQSRENLVCR